jgi:hypothetical protein
MSDVTKLILTAMITLLILVAIYGGIYLGITLLVWIGSFTQLYTFSWFLSLQAFLIAILTKAAIGFILPSKK